MSNIKLDDIQFKRFNKPLPPRSSPFKSLSLLLGLSLSSWAVFLTYSNNAERLSSSVVKELIRQSKFHPLTRDVLGAPIRPASDNWFLLGGLLGSTWVNGSVSMMQGKVDISLRLKGSLDSGTVYFTSIRNSNKDKFNILRYKLIDDNGTHHNLLNQSSIQDFESIE